MTSPDDAGLPVPEATDTDRLAGQVTGPDDHVGMTALWRLSMGLQRWWFLAVGEEGQEAPAAARIDGREMLLAFTTDERARHFAVTQGMLAPEGTLMAFSLQPAQVVASAGAYRSAGIAGLMFDPHLAGYFIPCEQLPVVWDAVMSTTGSSTDDE